MEKKLKNLKNSSYEITLTFNKSEYQKAENNAFSTLSKDVEVQGFRKGHAPKEMVEQKINKEYLNLLSFENLFNMGMKDVLEENKNIKFIGEPYDMDKKDGKSDEILLVFKLDTYPDVEILNKDWEKVKLNTINGTASKQDIEEAIVNLQKNYAEYKDTDVLTEKTVSRIAMSFLDDKGEELEKGFVYVGEPEFKAEKKEAEFWKKTFIGKKKGEKFEIAYKKTLNPVLQPKTSGLAVKNIEFNLLDIKQVELPEMNEANIKKFFGDKAEVKNKKELEQYIKIEIEKQKTDNELLKLVDEYLKNVSKKSMNVKIPQTLIKQEYASRMKSLEQRFNGPENTKKYLESLGEEKRKAFENDIRQSSEESLEKFFILQKICEHFKIDMNPENKGLEIEKQLYEKLKK